MVSGISTTVFYRLANFAVIGLVCCNRFSCSEGLLACDCETLVAYAVFDFAEVVDVDFGWLFAGVFGTFELDDCSWSCPWSSEEFNLFSIVFCVVAGKEHTSAFYALHFAWSEVCSDNYMLAEKLFLCKVWAKTALNNAFCATTVIQSFDIKLVALWVCFYLCDFCNAELNVLVEVFYNKKNMGVPLRSLTMFGRSGALCYGFRFRSSLRTRSFHSFACGGRLRRPSQR